MRGGVELRQPSTSRRVRSGGREMKGWDISLLFPRRDALAQQQWIACSCCCLELMRFWVNGSRARE